MEYDVIVIGGGAGGLVTAVGSRNLGFRVAIVDKEPLGGDCLHYGCVPSKTLIKSAKVAHSVRSADKYGLRATLAPTDFANVAAHIKSTIESVGVHDSADRFRKLGIDVYFGTTQFINPHTLSVKDGATEKIFQSKRFVIATGSSPFIPPIPGLEKVDFLTNKTIFSLNELPKRLLVIGGGPIGVEMAQAFQRLGSSVTLIDSGRQILGREDPEITSMLEEQLREEGMIILHDAKLVRVDKGIAVISMAEKEQNVPFDRILVATGRTPNVDGLALVNAGVNFSKKGIVVNDKLQTSQKHIYALGDVVGQYQFTHVAEYHAGIVVWNLFVPLKRAVSYRAVPWATYTDPELARVGMNEPEAKQQGIAYKTYTIPYNKVDRAVTEGYTRGAIKLLTTPKGGILGVTAFLPNAGEIIHEYVLAMQANISLRTIGSAVHIYPTVAQANRRVANQFLAEKFLTPRIQRIVRLLSRFS